MIRTCHSQGVGQILVVEAGTEDLLGLLQEVHLCPKEAAAPHLSDGVPIEEHVVALESW